MSISNRMLVVMVLVVVVVVVLVVLVGWWILFYSILFYVVVTLGGMGMLTYSFLLMLERDRHLGCGHRARVVRVWHLLSILKPHVLVEKGKGIVSEETAEHMASLVLPFP
jgi:hypothetical protein